MTVYAHTVKDAEREARGKAHNIMMELGGLKNEQKVVAIKKKSGSKWLLPLVIKQFRDIL